jgi:hypothetical protein
VTSPTPRAPGAPEARAREALGTVDPTPYFQKYGDDKCPSLVGSALIRSDETPRRIVRQARHLTFRGVVSSYC